MNLNYNDVSKLPSSLSNLCKLTSLYLCHNRLAELPELNLPSLRELHLANNCLKELSSEVLGGLRGLRVLDLRENKLDELPDDITLLQMLERLDLANNTLSSVPCHLGLLPHLRSMPLEGNPLRLLRRDIVQRGTRQLLQHLRDKLPNPASSYPGFGEDSCHPDGGTFKEAAEERLPKLPDKWQLRNTRQLVYSEKAASVPEELLQSAVEAEVPAVDLSGNTLAALPDKLAELSGHVKELVVSCNHLTCLPSYLATFTHLVFLDVHANRLDALPDLSALKFLRELNMTHNRFTSLPECLRGSQSLEILFAGDNRITEVDVSLVASWPRIATFHINNNNIGYLPPTLGNVTQIRSLLVEGNPFRVPRAAIIAKGTNEIMSYLRSRVVPGAE
ncbi:leucine-rich repeat-containing protein 40 [Hyalella azteca]|uniref:Leucine-rich repeat-containing protein 40 n=1 Tax=Hyalella azteca TaxID=294128 RepID=A0A8B7P855_HYAAZ|nr:leucine-rich repeat-containing protein 40 [Hyalella azteca]